MPNPLTKRPIPVNARENRASQSPDLPGRIAVTGQLGCLSVVFLVRGETDMAFYGNSRDITPA